MVSSLQFHLHTTYNIYDSRPIHTNSALSTCLDIVDRWCPALWLDVLTRHTKPLFSIGISSITTPQHGGTLTRMETLLAFAYSAECQSRYFQFNKVIQAQIIAQLMFGKIDRGHTNRLLGKHRLVKCSLSTEMNS